MGTTAMLSNMDAGIYQSSLFKLHFSVLLHLVHFPQQRIMHVLPIVANLAVATSFLREFYAALIDRVGILQKCVVSLADHFSFLVSSTPPSTSPCWNTSY
jgi:hypothetical protein